jgi:hypothetical protein
LLLLFTLCCCCCCYYRRKRDKKQAELIAQESGYKYNSVYPLAASTTNLSQVHQNVRMASASTAAISGVSTSDKASQFNNEMTQAELDAQQKSLGSPPPPPPPLSRDHTHIELYNINRSGYDTGCRQSTIRSVAPDIYLKLLTLPKDVTVGVGQTALTNCGCNCGCGCGCGCNDGCYDCDYDNKDINIVTKTTTTTRPTSPCLHHHTCSNYEKNYQTSSSCQHLPVSSVITNNDMNNLDYCYDNKYERYDTKYNTNNDINKYERYKSNNRDDDYITDDKQIDDGCEYVRHQSHRSNYYIHKYNQQPTTELNYDYV